MFIVKVDLPTGVAYFTGKKKVVQGEEFPGLTDDMEQARIFEDELDAQKFCKMLVKKYDMEFYYSVLDGEPTEESVGSEETEVSVPVISETDEQVPEGFRTETVVEPEPGVNEDNLHI